MSGLSNLPIDELAGDYIESHAERRACINLLFCGGDVTDETRQALQDRASGNLYIMNAIRAEVVDRGEQFAQRFWMRVRAL